MMIRKTIVLITGILAFAFSAIGQEDWQFWNEMEASIPVRSKWSLFLNVEQKLFGNISYLGCYNFTPGINYAFNEHFNVFLNYKYEREKENNESKFFRERRYELIPVISYKFDEWKLKLFSKLEYKVFEDKELFQLREALKIKHSVMLGPVELTPFIVDEVFFRLKEGRLNQNRLTIGIEKEFGKHLEVDLQFLLIHLDNGSRWVPTYVPGTFIGYSF